LSELRGFFIQDEGEHARVAFVDNNEKLVHYYLPMSVMKEGGVTMENQPFELDELEATLDGAKFTGHKVRPMAEPKDVRQDPLTLDPRSSDNLARILARAQNVKR
jgi:hypothetical protein